MHFRYVKLLTVTIVISVTAFLSSCERDESWPRIPGPEFKADVFVGKDLFTANCARCHGAALTGTGNAPSLLDTAYRPGHHGDMAFYLAVSKGVKQHHWNFGDMPPVPGLTGENVANIVAFVRQEQRRAGIR